MIWAQLLAYVTGTVDQELLLRNEYLVAENRILKAQIKGRLLLSEEFIRSGQILLVPCIRGCQITRHTGLRRMSGRRELKCALWR